MKTKALIYCRVSSEKQVTEGNGLGSQEQKCRTYAKGKGYTVERVFADEGVSGGLFERPAMKSLIEFLDLHVTENFVIIFDDLARLARDLRVHLKLKTELMSRGAKLESPNFTFEDTPEGEFIENILASKAQLDRQQNRRQVINRTKARLERGYWTFHAPFGMKFIKTAAHGLLLVANEPYASIYKDAIESYRDGILPTIEEVMHYVNKKYQEVGLHNKMSPSNAKRMLEEILYAGYLEYKNWGVELRKAQHEGFISIETHRKVQQRLSGVVKPWKRKDYNFDFPLRPLVLCAACQTPMTGSWSTGRHGGEYAHYYCRNLACQYVWKTIKKANFESDFERFLSKAKPHEEVLELARQILVEQWEEKVASRSTYLLDTKNTLEEISQKLKSYVERVGKTTDDDLIVEYEEQIKELRKQKNELLEQITPADEYTEKDFGTASERVFATLKKPVNMWQSDNYNDRRTILLMYFDNQLQYDPKIGFGTLSADCPINLIGEIADSKNLNVDD